MFVNCFELFRWKAPPFVNAKCYNSSFSTKLKNKTWGCTKVQLEKTYPEPSAVQLLLHCPLLPDALNAFMEASNAAELLSRRSPRDVLALTALMLLTVFIWRFRDVQSAKMPSLCHETEAEGERPSSWWQNKGESPCSLPSAQLHSTSSLNGCPLLEISPAMCIHPPGAPLCRTLSLVALFQASTSVCS